ncbi:MAG: hypothetical protein WCK98_04090 [bacterium]
MKLSKIFSLSNTSLNLRKKIPTGIKNYFIGILLMPWIWNFGFFGIQTLFVQFYLSRPNLERINTSLIASFNKQIIIWDVWKLVLFLLIGNYTISFFARQKQPKLSIILFLTTLLILFYLASLTIPFFRESIRND